MSIVWSFKRRCFLLRGLILICFGFFVWDFFLCLMIMGFIFFRLCSWDLCHYTWNSFARPLLIYLKTELIYDEFVVFSTL
jgi:hypothetical protein